MNAPEQPPLVAEAYLDRLVDTHTLPWIEHEVPLPGGTGKHAVKLLHADPATAHMRCLLDIPRVW